MSWILVSSVPRRHYEHSIVVAYAVGGIYAFDAYCYVFFDFEAGNSYFAR